LTIFVVKNILPVPAWPRISKLWPLKASWYAQSVRRSFPRNLAENSEAASFFCQTTSFETEVQEREPWDFYEWITCNEKPRCERVKVSPVLFTSVSQTFDDFCRQKYFTSPCLAKNKQVMATQSKLVCLKLVLLDW
jgi:hypothetical protein